MVISAPTAWQELARADFLVAPILTLLSKVLPLQYGEVGSSAGSHWQSSTEDGASFPNLGISRAHIPCQGSLWSVPQTKLDPAVSFVYKKPWCGFIDLLWFHNVQKGEEERNRISGYFRGGSIHRHHFPFQITSFKWDLKKFPAFSTIQLLIPCKNVRNERITVILQLGP